MKLYLSSFRFGNNPQQLADLVGENKKIGIIPNALDQYTDVARRNVSLQREADGLTAIGLNPVVIDLRDYFNKPTELKENLDQLGAVWVLGGNTFVLRKALHQSGMDGWLLDQRNNPEFVYAGFSAGICVITKDLKDIELIDPSNITPQGYDSTTIWEGLGLVNYSIVPHFETPGHPETEAAGKQVSFLIEHGKEFKALHDGDVIISQT
jgi:dipeptidase E